MPLINYLNELIDFSMSFPFYQWLNPLFNWISALYQLIEAFLRARGSPQAGGPQPARAQKMLRPIDKGAG